MPSEDLKVTLANHEYVVEPQPYAYLRFGFKKFLANLTDVDVDATDVFGMIGGNAYRLLELLIPGLMARYEFEGYSSATAYIEDQPPPALSDEALELLSDEQKEELAAWEQAGPDAPRSSPTQDQIITAIETAAKVNRLDLVKHLKGLVDADFLSVILKRAMLEFAQSSLPSESPSLPTSTGSAISSTTASPSSEPTASEPAADGMPYEEADAPPQMAGAATS